LTTELARHGLLYFVSKAGPAVISFATIAVFSRLLTPREYGLYALVLASAVLANATGFQWLRLSVLRFLPAFTARRPDFIATVRTKYNELAIIIIVGAVILAVLPVKPGFRWPAITGIYLFLALAAHEGVLEFARSDLLPSRYASLALVRAAGALACGAALIAMGMGGLGAVLGVATGAALGATLGGVPLLRGARSGVYDPEIGRTLVAYGVPLTAGFALEFVLGTSDRLLIGWLVSTDAAGLYAVAYDIPRQMLGTVTGSIVLATFPLAVRAVEKSGLLGEAARNQLRLNVIGISLVAFPAGVGLCLVVPNLASVFLGAEYRTAVVQLTPLIVTGVALHSFRIYYFDHAFQLAKRPAGQIIAAGAAAAVNVGLNLLLLPRLGVIAAAYSTVGAYVVALIASFLLGRRLLSMPIPAATLVRIALASAVMGLGLAPLVDRRGVVWLGAQVLVGLVLYASMVFILDVGGSKSLVARTYQKAWKRARQKEGP
jgi:O-antigen/teichoic acid export membrane protein